MGLFLCFSYDHSSLVANVRNLRTGYVSPQFLVEFDDLFQTVFSLGDNNIVADTICKQLFGSNWNIYAKDVFSVDGELIYSLPPSDEVWLSEPECWDRREKVQAKHCQHEECLFIQFHDNPPPTSAHSPDVATNLDDDSYIDSWPHVEMSKSEGGIWPDHSNAFYDYSHDCDSVGPNVVEPDPDPSSLWSLCPILMLLAMSTFQQEWQWSRHDDGWLQCYSKFSSFIVDNLTYLEWIQYAYSISSKQMPPTASHLSRKNLKYSQWLAKKKELGDMSMNSVSFDVASVEELMKSPLAKFTVVEVLKIWLWNGFIPSFWRQKLQKAKMIIQVGGGLFADEY